MKQQKTPVGVMCNRITRLLVLLALFSFSSASFSENPSGAKIQAAYFYNTLKFAVWPDAEPINVMLIGDDAVSRILKKILPNYQIKNNEIIVNKINESTLIADDERPLFREVDAIYVSSTLDRTSVVALLGIVSQSKVLTISTYSGFAGLGGMIEISRRSNASQQFDFLVNITALKQQELILQSQFLRLTKPIDSH